MSLRHVAQPVKAQGDSPTGPARHEARPDEQKPRLKRFHGQWNCYRAGDNFHITCGLGFDPLAAYEDWKRMQEKYAA